MEYLLVRFHDNWSDEMDMEGFDVLPKTEWESFQAKVKEYFTKDGKTLSIGFGTNEEQEYDCEELTLQAFSAQPITEEEAGMLKKLFNLGWGGYGQFHLESVLEAIHCNEERL